MFTNLPIILFFIDNSKIHLERPKWFLSKIKTVEDIGMTSTVLNTQQDEHIGIADVELLDISLETETDRIDCKPVLFELYLQLKNHSNSMNINSF